MIHVRQIIYPLRSNNSIDTKSVKANANIEPMKNCMLTIGAPEIRVMLVVAKRQKSHPKIIAPSSTNTLELVSRLRSFIFASLGVNRSKCSS